MVKYSYKFKFNSILNLNYILRRLIELKVDPFQKLGFLISNPNYPSSSFRTILTQYYDKRPLQWTDFSPCILISFHVGRNSKFWNEKNKNTLWHLVWRLRLEHKLLHLELYLCFVSPMEVLFFQGQFIFGKHCFCLSCLSESTEEKHIDIVRF